MPIGPTHRVDCFAIDAHNADAEVAAAAHLGERGIENAHAKQSDEDHIGQKRRRPDAKHSPEHDPGNAEASLNDRSN